MSRSKFLGIDYGTKRIGLAVSDRDGRLAFPKTILENTESVFDELKKIIDLEQISEIVVGESIDSQGRPNAVAAHIGKFLEGLESFNLPVHSEKEFFTSYEARRLKPEEKLARVDASAAALILQRYLDRVNLPSKDYR